MRYTGNKGLTLIGLIAAMLVLSLLAVGILTVVTTGMLSSVGTSDASAAFFAAETGISVERANLITNTNTPPYTKTGSIAGATYSAVISTNMMNPGGFIITSTGKKNDSEWTSIWVGTNVIALVAYRHRTSNEPHCRIYTDTKSLCHEQYAQSANGEPQWQRIVASPLSNQFLLVTQNNSREIYAQTWLNGVWFNCTRLNGSGLPPDADARAYDVTYESLSGRGMVVYSINGVNPLYRVLIGTNWSGQTSITNLGATGPISWVRLVPKPDSNEIMLLARWQNGNNYSGAIIWDGANTWINPQSLESNCASEIAYETMDAAWSTNSAMVMYINEPNIKQPKYRIYTNSWSGEMAMPALNNDPRWIRVEFSPDNAYAYAGFSCKKQGNDKRLQGALWNGSTWSSYDNFGNLEIGTPLDQRDFDIAWSSQDNTLMLTYCARNQATHSYATLTPGSGFSSPASMAPGTYDGRWSVLKADPRSSEFLYISLDFRDDVNVQRWNGSSWIMILPIAVEVWSEVSHNSIDIAFRRDLSAP